MKTLIALAPKTGFADAIRSSLDASDWRVIHHGNSQEAGLLQISGGVDGIILESNLEDIAPIREIERLQKLQPGVPVLIYKETGQLEWEEQAYLAGALYIIPKPVRRQLLELFLGRAISDDSGASGTMMDKLPSEISEPKEAIDSSSKLTALRSFSHVLTHSLVSKSLPRQFLQLLRNVLGVNRAAIFLQPSSFGIQPTVPSEELRSACAIGIPDHLLKYFELSIAAGIGQYLQRHGRILKKAAVEARADLQVQKEFALLGAQVAIPIPGRDGLIGVAVFDERLTGEPFTSAELTMVFHALEELGLAIQNSRLYDELASNHALLTDILDVLTSGCVVIDKDLTVVHGNPAARRLLDTKPEAVLQFSDLPQVIGSRVFEALKTGETVASFRYKPVASPEQSYHISVIPFQQQKGGLPGAAMLLIEDFTQVQRAQELEIEASNLRTIRSMAEHLSHEIGNALVPMSTHHQLLDEQYEDQEFRGSLSVALSQGIKRISRLSNQMLYLTREEVTRQENIPSLALLNDAFRDAETLYGLNGRKLEIAQNSGPLNLLGNRKSLLHALSELLLNALQSSPPDSQIKVQCETTSGKENGVPKAKILIIDNGPGFTAELAAQAAHPFFSTRTTGPGLGLTVARKIIESHHGHLSVIAGEAHGKVQITLPLRIGMEQNGQKFNDIESPHLYA